MSRPPRLNQGGESLLLRKLVSSSISFQEPRPFSVTASLRRTLPNRERDGVRGQSTDLDAQSMRAFSACGKRSTYTQVSARIGFAPVRSLPGFTVAGSDKVDRCVGDSVGCVECPRASGTELDGRQREYRNQRAAMPFIIRNVDGRGIPRGDDERVIDLDLLGRAEIHRAVDVVFGFFESFACLQRLDLSTAVFDGQRAALDDVVCATWMVVPLQRF